MYVCMYVFMNEYCRSMTVNGYQRCDYTGLCTAHWLMNASFTIRALYFIRNKLYLQSLLLSSPSPWWYSYCILEFNYDTSKRFLQIIDPPLFDHHILLVEYVKWYMAWRCIFSWWMCSRPNFGQSPVYIDIYGTGRGLGLVSYRSSNFRNFRKLRKKVRDYEGKLWAYTHILVALI